MSFSFLYLNGNIYSDVRGTAGEHKSPSPLSFRCTDMYGFSFQICSYRARNVALALLQVFYNMIQSQRNTWDPLGKMYQGMLPGA